MFTAAFMKQNDNMEIQEYFQRQTMAVSKNIAPSSQTGFSAR